jgi:hypothetical protein
MPPIDAELQVKGGPGSYMASIYRKSDDYVPCAVTAATLEAVEAELRASLCNRYRIVELTGPYRLPGVRVGDVLPHGDDDPRPAADPAIAEADRLYEDGRYLQALDVLESPAFDWVTARAPEADGALEEVLMYCTYDYLTDLSRELEIDFDPDRPVEAWVRAIDRALPPEQRMVERPRLAMVAIVQMLNVLLRESDFGDAFADVRAAAADFLAARLALAGRHRELIAFGPTAQAWLDGVWSTEPEALAHTRLRLLRDTLGAADALGLDAEAEAAFAAADRLGRDHPQAWREMSTAILSRYARRLAGRGKGREALEVIDRAVAEAVDRIDRQYAAMIRGELRQMILGEEPDYADVVEALVPHGRSAVEEVRRLIGRIEAGDRLGAGELNDIAGRLAALHGALAEDPQFAEETLGLRVKFALSLGHRHLAQTLRAELAARADLPGRAGIEARGLTLALAGLLHDRPPDAAPVAALLADARRQVAGLEALLSTRVLSLLVANAGTPALAPDLLAWFRHLARSLGEEADWGGGRLQLMEESKWWFPEVELAALMAASLGELTDDEAMVAEGLRAALAIFSAGHGVAARTDGGLRAAAAVLVEGAEGRQFFDRLAEAVQGKDATEIAAAREDLLSALYRAAGAAGQAAGTDDGEQPQILLIETRAIVQGEPALFLVDTLEGRPRLVVRGEDRSLRSLVDGVFDHETWHFDKGCAAALGQMLMPYPVAGLPRAFGIRGSGLIHAVPFSALPAGDGRVVGECAVPVLMTAPDSRLDPVIRPFRFGRSALLLADPDYEGNGAGEGLGPDQVTNPTTGSVTTLDAFWRVGGPKEAAPRTGDLMLPGTRIEVLTVADRLAGHTTTEVLLGRRATREALLTRLRTAPPALLHLAVHGFSGDTPAAAHLALSPVGSDGAAATWAVTFDDIALLDLSAIDLVVLSACSTMRGSIRRGEGILALAWAFRAAGARAVITTRWDVDDIASALYWRAFYGHLAEGGDVCGGMMAGRGVLMENRQFRAPRHWAAYQLIV